MRPIQANSDFYQNRSKVDSTMTMTLHNPNGAVMSIFDAAGGNLITTVPPGDTITVSFFVKAGGQLHADLSGAGLFHGVAF